MSFKQPEGSWHLFTGYKELKFELEVPEIITISSKYKIKDILDLNLNLFKPIISIAQLVLFYKSPLKQITFSSFYKMKYI